MSAPASQAALASGQLVMPHILTRIMSRLNRQRRAPEKSSKRRARIRREHQTFADEKRVEPGLAKFREIVMSAEARFADGHAGVRDTLDKFERSLDAQIQSLQIAIVDPDDAGICRKRAFEFGGRVNFDERLHFQLAAECDKVAQEFVMKSSNNQQKTVCVVRTRFPDLPGIKDEVLAKDRNLYRVPRVAEIFQRAAKEFAFRENGKHRGARIFQSSR